MYGDNTPILPNLRLLGIFLLIIVAALSLIMFIQIFTGLNLIIASVAIPIGVIVYTIFKFRKDSQQLAPLAKYVGVIMGVGGFAAIANGDFLGGAVTVAISAMLMLAYYVERYQSATSTVDSEIKRALKNKKNREALSIKK